MDPPDTEISRVSGINKSLLTQEEADISRTVAERRKELRAFATCSKWKSCGNWEYRLAVVDSIREICGELTVISTTLQNDHVGFPRECQVPISRDPCSALFGEPKLIYESINLVEWLTYLPVFCQQYLGGTSFGLNYRRQDSMWMAGKCVWVLEMICNELQGIRVYEAHRKIVDGKPRDLSEEEVARIRKHLSAAVDEWHCLGVEPAKIAEEIMATILYTTELKTAGMESIIGESEIHGKNPSLYGVMNWSVRVFKDLEKSWNNEQMKALERTIQLFLPILARIDVFLSRLPVYRTTLFRGIRAHIPASMYKTGLLIPWTALSSTTADFRTAYEFGYTLFIAHVYNAPAIDFATVYPEEAEHLMPTYSWVKAVSVMSPTLLRILGSTCNYITVQSAGDEPSIDELIERLVRKEESRLLIFEKFVSRYVEAGVHPAPPPLPHDARIEPLFKAVCTFLASESEQHLLLLGSGGSGKSSALLAVYCELSRQSVSIRGRPLIPVFIPLPSLAIGTEGPVVLDRALFHYLGVSPLQLVEISSHCELVVLLDSLDECGDQVKSWFPLLDKTELCCKVRVIVSCRTEYFSDKVSPSSDLSTSSNGGACSILHVQPFSRNQVDLFLEKASGDIACPISVDLLFSLGIPGELLELPVALTMGVEVVRNQRQFGECVNSVPFLDFMCPEKTRVGLYSAYLNTCRFRVKRELADSKVTETLDIFDAESTASLRKALQDVAITMLAQGKWRLPVSEIRTMFGKYFGNTRNAVNNALHHSPMRLESLDDPDAEFSFWHKSIGEFLCATALCGHESKRYLEMTGRGKSSAFSKRELNVLSLFNELTTPLGRRKEICGNTLLGALIESRDLKKQNVVLNTSLMDSKAVVASNAMALLAISQFPLQGVDLRNLLIKNCLAYEGNFRNAILDGTCFEDCDLNRSDFEGASIDGTEFVECTFGPLKQAPLEGHKGSVWSACWSPDGTLIATGSEDETIRLWDISSGREVKKYEGHTAHVWCVSWSPDGNLIASGSYDKTVRLWETVSGNEVKKLEGHKGSVECVCWSPDCELVASGARDNTVRVWEVASGQELKKLNGHGSSVLSVCWSPDGKLVASGSWDDTIRVWNVASGREVKKLVGHGNHVWSVCWSSDGKLVASGSLDHSVRLWDVATGSEVKKFDGHTSSVRSVCWSPDDKLVVSGSDDDTIRVWDTSSGREMKKLEGHISSVETVHCSPNGKLIASGSADHNIRVWELASGREVKKLNGHGSGVRSVSWSYDGKLIASGSDDNSIRVWKVASGREVKKLVGHNGSVMSVCWSPDSALIASAGSDDRTIRLWEVATGREIKKLEGHSFLVNSVCWSLDGKLVVSGSDDGTVRVWEAVNGCEMKTLEGHTSYVMSSCWSPDGKLVASGSADESIRVWNIGSGCEVKSLKGHTDIVRSVCWSPDGNLVASGSDDHTVRVWDIASGLETKKLEGHTSSVECVSWSPDNKLVASGSNDESIRVWEVATWRVMKKLEGHTGCVRGLCWSPDGKLIASGSDDRTIRIWEISVKDERAVQNAFLSEPISCFVLGRQPAGIPPFKVHGELGLHSRSNPFLSRYLFKTPSNEDQNLQFKSAP